MPTLALIVPALLVLVVSAVCCALRVNTLFVLWELKRDRVNPHDGVRLMNEHANVEMSAHAIRVLLFALAGDTWGVVLSAPLVAWHWSLWQQRAFLADVTEILKPAELAARRRRAFIEIAAYGTSFLYAVWSLVELLFARWLADPVVFHGLKALLPSARKIH